MADIRRVETGNGYILEDENGNKEVFETAAQARAEAHARLMEKAGGGGARVGRFSTHQHGVDLRRAGKLRAE